MQRLLVDRYEIGDGQIVSCRYPRMSSRGVFSWHDLRWTELLHLFSFFLSRHQNIAHLNMKKLNPTFVGAVITVMVILPASDLMSAEWSVPLAGNLFRTAPRPGGQGIRRDGVVSWANPEAVFTVFFHVDRPCDLQLALRGRIDDGRSILRTRVVDASFESTLSGSKLKTADIGRIHVPKAGYVQVELQGHERTGANFGDLRDLLVASETDGLKLDYVKTNEGSMFYWGRRGPSVHLSYQVPKGRPLQYAYSEITVPVGQDPIGSYFMANGFGEGYFGIQVNSPTERRVLFSVWSPFNTDNPRDIPEDQRIRCLGRGPDVHIGEFGNEGSGGQSYLVYPWKAGATYRFLTEVTPDGKGNTVYTSWFGNKAAGEWRLIASFRRPQTDTHLRRFHSFLESFSPAFGHIGRSAFYGNVWVADLNGKWFECTDARFTVDATGSGRHRLDFTGGSDAGRFYLKNCGFFDGSGRPGELFSRDAKTAEQPKIDFESLPRG